jgi:LAO/AO transport system kinase
MARDVQQLYERMISGDRTSLGLAMTLVESNLKEDRHDAMVILEKCENQLAQLDPSMRLAISGSPGVGKSTFIEVIGQKAIEHGHKVGVITIDPTSSLSQGSILGDKSRMSRLSSSPNAFIRSSPAGSVLGGLGRRSMELMTLLAASGYDLILLETVGVGQSEHITWQFTDGFILVIQPGGGDELQGIKRGITELADLVVVNKGDGPLTNLAKVAKAQYETALHYFSSTREGWLPKILTCSATEGTGIREVWDALLLYNEYLTFKPERAKDRANQKLKWLSWSLSLTAQQLLTQHPLVKAKIEAGEAAVLQNPASAFTIENQIENLMNELIQNTSSKEKQ